MYASRCCVLFQAPPVIAVQLGALGWIDAPAECMDSVGAEDVGEWGWEREWLEEEMILCAFV